ncbi:hypothetical protein F5B21DRAFT_496177 [Xylaria acuta]|nr:hypothetical protein F5B21DRAFT_496177 [Xylaria acuta]
MKDPTLWVWFLYLTCIPMQLMYLSDPPVLLYRRRCRRNRHHVCYSIHCLAGPGGQSMSLLSSLSILPSIDFVCRDTTPDTTLVPLQSVTSDQE